MTSYTKYKQAMITALTVIMLCVISLTGATFALFTTNEEDGTIGINVLSGKVDVDIVDSEGNTLVGSYLKFDIPNGADKVLFEPGATFYTQSFKIVNVGSVPVKFKVYISNDDSIDSEILMNSFEFFITDDVTTRDSGQKITSFSGELELNASSNPYYMIVSMNEDAGNELIGKSCSGIGITIYAVQGNANIE